MKFTLISGCYCVFSYIFVYDIKVETMDTEVLVKKQMEEMAKHKWIESEKAGYDLGDAAYLDWVDKYIDRLKMSKDSKKK